MDTVSGGKMSCLVFSTAATIALQFLLERITFDLSGSTRIHLKCKSVKILEVGTWPIFMINKARVEVYGCGWF